MSEKEKNDEEINIGFLQEMQELKAEYIDIEKKSKHERDKVKDIFEEKLDAFKDKISDIVENPRRIVALVGMLAVIPAVSIMKDRESKPIEPTYNLSTKTVAIVKGDEEVNIGLPEEIKLSDGEKITNLDKGIVAVSKSVDETREKISKDNSVEVLSDEQEQHDVKEMSDEELEKAVKETDDMER